MDTKATKTIDRRRFIRDASAVAIASPVYRASYPGVLKNFLAL
jgi:NAD(P)H-dependent FMN reductase